MGYKLALGTKNGFSISVEDEVRIIKKAGFDAFFSDCDTPENMIKYAHLAKELELDYIFHHARFGDMHLMWEGSDEEAESTLSELKDEVNACCAAGVPMLVCHVIIGMQRHNPNETGAQRFQQLCEYANEKGIKIAFENTEGAEYLKAVMDKCSHLKNVGFCYDSGHEKCYNYDRDMLSLYGERLFATHLNDNLGMTDQNNMTWLDDLHLLPFDGNADWESIARRLRKSAMIDYLTLELNVNNKPDRHEHDIYSEMSAEEYIKKAFERAEKIRDLITL